MQELCFTCGFVRVLLGWSSLPLLSLNIGNWNVVQEFREAIRIGFWHLGVGTGAIVGALAFYGFQHHPGTTFK